jgi:RHS repeat-associated protein
MCYNNNPNVSDSMPDNNGNLQKQSIYIPGNDRYSTDWFTYDKLNRLQSANETDLVYATSQTHDLWRQTYVYDRYGNRTIDTNPSATNGGVNNLGFEIEQSTNRLYAPGDLAQVETARRMRYDPAGNLKQDIYTGAGDRVYDAENRMKQAWANGQWQTYSYDGDGRRVARTVNGVVTWQVYGLGGELLAEYAQNADRLSPQKEYGYRNGQLLITATAGSGWGSAPTYTPPNPLIPGVEIKLEHLTELRTAVNLLRVRAGLPAVTTWNPDNDPHRNETYVHHNHIQQLRTKLEEALTALHLPIGGYAHSGPNPGDPIYAIDFQELRNQITAAWSSVQVNWLVSDQLGTPRMVFDQSGALATVSRHDYLPFGEDLTVGGRSTNLGYTNSDGARQKFTQKERDNETGLDYFLARYYSSTQGRFTSPDEFAGGPTEIFAAVAAHNPTFYAEIAEPQSLNKYQYCLNNPLRYVDPDGHQTITADAIWNAASGGSARVVQGAVVHAGVTLVHDGRLRAEYASQARALPRGPLRSATRELLKGETRQKMTALGRTISEAADSSRVGQLAGKTLAQAEESAGRTSQFWNSVGIGAERAAPFLLVTGATISAANIATAPEGQRGVTTVSEAGAWGGALIGTVGGPPGAAAGAIIGGLVGSEAGAAIGSGAAREMYNRRLTPEESHAMLKTVN